MVMGSCQICTLKQWENSETIDTSRPEGLINPLLACKIGLNMCSPEVRQALNIKVGFYTIILALMVKGHNGFR